VADGSSLKLAAGSFFDRQGFLQEGSILHLGAIGALGLSAKSGGSLARDEDGRFRLTMRDDEQAVMQYMSARPVQLVPVQLFDPLQENKTSIMQRSWIQEIESGGPLVYPILGLGLLALMLLLERLIFLGRLAYASKKSKLRLASMLERESGKAELLAFLKEPGPLLRIFAADSLLHVDQIGGLRQEVAQTLENEQPALTRFLGTLHVIAAVSPLLGLLGTVTGMIGTFAVISAHGTGDPQLLSGGISEALVTTELGLLVAIPTLLARHIIAALVEKQMARYESLVERVLCAFDKFNSTPSSPLT
jgi:biopolymer transport protein ExbB